MCPPPLAGSVRTIPKSRSQPQEEANGSAPGRRGGRNTPVVNPSREFEDIYDRMGQLMNLAFGLTPAALADMPWVPLADLSICG